MFLNEDLIGILLVHHESALHLVTLPEVCAVDDLSTEQFGLMEFLGIQNVLGSPDKVFQQRGERDTTGLRCKEVMFRELQKICLQMCLRIRSQS